MNRDLFLSSILNYYEKVQFSQLLKRNEELRNKHKGQRAFLFATGTSILDLDLSKYNGEITIGCNDILKHPSFSALDLKYYTVGVPYRWFRELGPRFTHDHHHKYFSMIEQKLKDKDTKHFYHATIRKYLKKRNLLKDKECYYLLGKPIGSDKDEISMDITKPNSFYDGGLRNMIALAIFMGCKEIYLFGCGYTYSPVQAWHFHNCLTMEKDPSNFSDENMQDIIKAFYQGHPEAIYGKMKTNIVKRANQEYLVDFFYHKKIDKNGDDFYKKHRVIRKFTDTNDIRISNIVPKGYESPIYEKFDEEKLWTILR